jgi:hypothetical protein
LDTKPAGLPEAETASVVAEFIRLTNPVHGRASILSKGKAYCSYRADIRQTLSKARLIRHILLGKIVTPEQRPFLSPYQLAILTPASNLRLCATQ